MSEKSLGTRLSSLVEQVHGGSVNAAARDLGVAQQTLGRIIDGSVQNPRSRLLQSIAAFYGVTLDWLVSGSGTAPSFDPAQPTSDIARWNALVDSLQPSDELRAALQALPLSLTSACVIIEAGLRISQKSDAEARESRRIASGLEYEAWTTALSGWIAVAGPDRVRAQLERHLPEIRVGFNPSALRSQQARRDRQRKTTAPKRK